MTDMMSNEFPWAEGYCPVPDDYVPEIPEEWQEAGDEHDCDFFPPADDPWWTQEPNALSNDQMKREMRSIEDATEHAFALCQREINFCLNNEMETRLGLAANMKMELSNWIADYATAEGFGEGQGNEACFEQTSKLMPVFATVYLRCSLLLGVDTCEGVIRNVMQGAADGIEELTEEQERLAEEHMEHFLPCLWMSPLPSDMRVAGAEDAASALGRAVVRSLASGILNGSEDELACEVAALDNEGLPALATAFLAAAAATTDADDLYAPEFAPALYAVMCGNSDKDTGTPSLGTPAGVIDLLRYEMTEEGVRYFASLPFRRGYEWHGCGNHIIVPNKSDEELLDHLLREGVLMPFYERVFQGCVRKDSYDTYEEARERADEYEARDGARRLRVYLCPFCGKYHLTHMRRYVSRDGVNEEEELERSIYRHGARSREFLLAAGAEFLEKNKKRIIFRIRQEWERRYGGRRYDRRRAA